MSGSILNADVSCREQPISERNRSASASRRTRPQFSGYRHNVSDGHLLSVRLFPENLWACPTVARTSAMWCASARLSSSEAGGVEWMRLIITLSNSTKPLRQAKTRFSLESCAPER